MSKVTVSFDRRVTRDGYYVGTTVLPSPDTDPSSFEDSIMVAAEGASGVVRAMTLIDLYNFPTADSEAIKLDYLTYDGYFNVLAVGDIITFYSIPYSWEVAGDAPTLPISLTVTDVTNAPAGGSVKVDTSLLVNGEFASGFSGNLDFEVNRDTVNLVARGIYPIIMGRYPANVDVAYMYYRVKRDVTVYENVETAMNKYESLQAEFQSLVDDANTAGTDFETPSTEVFE